MCLPLSLSPAKQGQKGAAGGCLRVGGGMCCASPGPTPELNTVFLGMDPNDTGLWKPGV